MTLNGAIMQLVEMRENSMMPVVFKPYFDKVIETISECVEPSEIPHWIPVTERLPEQEARVLTCSKYGDIWINDYNPIAPTAWAIEPWTVIAWMPLPQPYTEETNA